MLSYFLYDHALGQLPVVAYQGRLVYIGAFGEPLADCQADLDPKGRYQWQEQELPEICLALDQYFSGQAPLELAYDFIKGTDFQQAVWRTLAQIPYGQTCSYKELAQALGRPKAVRAVANAVGQNPLSILLPCHRVLAHDGSLGGYRGGLDMKTYLLNLEGTGPKK